jgi:hypothetical protein
MPRQLRSQSRSVKSTAIIVAKHKSEKEDLERDANNEKRDYEKQMKQSDSSIDDYRKNESEGISRLDYLEYLIQIEDGNIKRHYNEQFNIQAKLKESLLSKEKYIAEYTKIHKEVFMLKDAILETTISKNELESRHAKKMSSFNNQMNYRKRTIKNCEKLLENGNEEEAGQVQLLITEFIAN